MKNRIVILLSVTLAVLLLVVGVAPTAMPTSPALAQQTGYEYVVPFVCGWTTDLLDSVNPGNYATTVNVHNPNPSTVSITWKVVRVWPLHVLRCDFAGLDIKADAGRAFRCKNICNRLGIPHWPPPYFTGFVVIKCYEELDVYAVYTVQYDLGETSIAVEHILAR